MNKYTIAISPCPNDTFIFDAMVHQKIDTLGFEFDYVLEDVATLNDWALQEKYPISKISYAVLPLLTNAYKLLPAGSALGKGVGPLLLMREPLPSGVTIADYLRTATIAIPGTHTTAHFLLNAAFPEAQNKQVVLFSDIEQGLIDGKFDVGLVIHESRFTYQDRGLHCIMDMGKWWETEMNLPIPLGGIVIQKAVPQDDALKIAELIKQSIQYAWNQYPNLGHFITENAQEMSEDVMRKHINLYVNKNSEQLDDLGKAAIEKLMQLASNALNPTLEWVV